jgi:hypothetical protein
MYGMQRANGDWFALNDGECLRMPVFRSSIEAMQARSLNPAMLLFKPVVLDESALESLAQTETEAAACFWLVSDAANNLRRGEPLEHAQFVLRMREPGAELAQG